MTPDKELQFKIEHGIKFPQRTKYPFEDMKVGDSFFVLGEKNLHPRAFWATKRFSPKVFRGAKTKDGFRIWRIK